MCSFHHVFFILLRILNILNVLFHYYLFLSLVKGEEYLPFFSVCEKNEYFVLPWSLVL